MRRKKQSKDIVVVVNVKKLLMLLLTLLLCLLAIFSILHVVKHFMKLRRFEVEGVEKHYEDVDLINASNVRLGEYLYRLDRDEIEERLLRECPFLLDVTVKPVFPNRLRIIAEEREIPWYVEISGAKYALDRDMLVIDEIADTKDMAELVLPSVRRVIAGSVPEFSSGEGELRRTLEAIAVIRSAPFYKRLTKIDLSNSFNIQLVADGSFTIELGEISNLSAKLEAVQAVFESDRLEGATGGKIYAADPGSGVAVSVTKEEGDSSVPQKGD